MDDKRAAFAAAFDELCRQCPLPPLPYPDTQKKLKLLKSLMKKQKSREHYSRALMVQTMVTGYKGQKFTQWAIHIHCDFHRRHIAEACRLPVDHLHAIYTLLYS